MTSLEVATKGESRPTTRAITFADLGITITPAVANTFIGKARTWNDIGKWEWLFLSISVPSVLTTVGLTIERLSFAITHPVNTTCIQIVEAPTISPSPIAPMSVNVDFTFALLLLINTVVCLFFIFYGIIRERASAIAIFVIACFIVIIYCITDYSTNICGRSLIKLGRLIVIGTFGPLNIILGLYIARQYCLSKNLIMRTVGANIEMQNKCKLMFFCEDLLKFDLQLEISMIVLVLEATKVGLLGKLVIGLGTTFSVLWIICGILAMVYENTIMVWFFFATSMFEPAYIIYKIYDAITDDNDLSQYVFMGGTLAIVVRVFLIIIMAFVFRNFGKGLKGKAYNCVKVSDNPLTTENA